MKFKCTILLICFISVLSVTLTAQSINDLHTEVKALEQKLASLKKQNATLRELRIVEIQLTEKKKELEEKVALNRDVPDLLEKHDIAKVYVELKAKYPNFTVLRQNLEEALKGKVVRLDGYVVTHFWKTIQQSWLQGSDWMQIDPQAFFVDHPYSYDVAKELHDGSSYCSYPCSILGDINLFLRLKSGVTETDNQVIKYPFDNKLLKSPFTSENCQSIECSAISYEAHKFNYYFRVKYSIEAEITNVTLKSINMEWTEMHNYLQDALELELSNVHFEVLKED